MRLLIWITAAALLLPWTLTIAATAWLLRWSVELTAAGEAADAVAIVSDLQLPAWLTWWVDSGWVLATLDGLAHALEALQAALPWLASIVGWLVVLLWVVWGLGTLVLLVVAWVASWAVGRGKQATALAS